VRKVIIIIIIIIIKEQNATSGSPLPSPQVLTKRKRWGYARKVTQNFHGGYDMDHPLILACRSPIPNRSLSVGGPITISSWVGPPLFLQ